MAALATIGVYGFDAESFMQALREADVRQLVDVRQRRGVRGPEYAWANSRRLQASLAQAGIEYRHLRELAPTTELRQLQYREDARQNVGKRSRLELDGEYKRRYLSEVLDKVDLGRFLESLPENRTSALLCVEREAGACHRSLIVSRLRAQFRMPVLDV